MPPIKSLLRGIDVLEAFLNLDEEVQLADIAKKAGLDKSTVNRIVNTWVSRGYLNQSGKRGKYSLGTKFFEFSGLKKKRSRIRNIAMPHMTELAKSTRETVVLAVLNGMIADHNTMIPSEFPLKISPPEGTRVPLYCTGVGKVLLANMSKQDLDEYFRVTELKANTPNTITHPDILRNHLVKIAKENIAFDDEEDILGVRNVASGIRDEDNKVIASVGVLSPSTRLSRDRMNEIAIDVMECARKISADVGCKDC